MRLRLRLPGRRVIPRILVRNLAARAGVEFVDDTLGDTVEEVRRVDAEEVPGDIEGLEDGAGLVGGLVDEGAFELVEELEGELVFGGEGVFSDDGFHGSGVSANGVFGVELVGDVGVVGAGAALADGGLHQTG